ncbi:MAG: FtsX-like permease family protein, partial [Alphaproteobacteria bacterium]|nr:FtsX-like permease family protein [Alphaproteobacteria bacterium]
VNRTALVLGIDPHSKVYPFEGLDQQQSILQMRDTALFDEYSKPEFGPIKQIIQDKGHLDTEINGIRIQIAGTYKMGITFSADGNIITNDITFFKLFPNKTQDGVDVGIITLNDGVDPKIVQEKFKKILPPDVQLFTKDEYIADERAYWNDLTPIGFIFNFGAVMGLVVGLVIVYQVLFNDITNHLKEYATLKAMGFKNSYFVKAVMTSAVTLATLGFIPGAVIIYGLFHLIESTIYIQMPMPVSFVLFNFALIIVMCLGSALLAVRKLKSSNPVDIFA